ncbi:hypothetical protein NC653_016382 [Populus alba x Populus x berolinensis]|uniref:Uncharacterized protein n=1 Tax=Populus alba x Populus x berolinensis TaxID=444605 RepID=A0AAD6QMS4_9ROSI|nr:hypothetical protein NC653_016382 [Populus alba x Populus x berolinensis]
MVGFALLYAHGAFRVPDDLFLDDQEPANAGFLSFLGGDASSAAAPAGVAHYEYQVKLQKKRWRDDLKRLKETKKRGKDSINDYHDTREDVDRDEDDSFARFCSPGRRMCKLDCMYDSIC